MGLEVCGARHRPAARPREFDQRIAQRVRHAEVEAAGRARVGQRLYRRLCAVCTDGTRDQSLTQEGCAARSRQGSVHESRQAARLEKATVLREIVVVLVLASPSGVVLECEHVFCKFAGPLRSGGRRAMGRIVLGDVLAEHVSN